MKSIRALLMVGIVLMSGLACGIFGSGGEPEEDPEASIVPTSGGDAYPTPYVIPLTSEGEPAAAYPEFSGAQPALPAGMMIYPELADGDVIEWDLIPGLVYSGYATQILQTHELEVYVTLLDGRTLMAIEPEVDEILRLIESCGDLCKNVRVATE